MNYRIFRLPDLSIIGQFTWHCIVYVVLNTLGCLWALNSMLYCVFRIPNVFFCHLNNLIPRNHHYFWKTYEKIYTFFSFTQFDSKNVYNCIENMKIINKKQTLLYNLPTIHSIQRYNGSCELTKYFIAAHCPQLYHFKAI